MKNYLKSASFLVIIGIIFNIAISYTYATQLIEPDECGEEHTYTFSSGGQNGGDDNSKPGNIDFTNTGSSVNTDTVTVTADDGFIITKVELSVDDDGKPGFYQYASGPVTAYNPNPGTTINVAKVTVKKYCPDVCLNIVGDQYTVPERMILEDGQCVLPLNEEICPQGYTGTIPNCVPPVNSCEDEIITSTLVSDTSTLVDLNPAVLLSFIHGYWTASISGANWIWDQEPIPDAVNETVVTFSKNFNITGTPTGGNLMIAGDNAYEVILNGDPLCSDHGEFNYSSEGQDNCVILAEDLVSGENTVNFKVKNFAIEGATSESNPAGLMYKLTIDSNSCVPPPVECEEGFHLEGETCVSDENNEETPVDVCANIEGNQASVPESYHQDGANCVANETTPNPESTPESSSNPTSNGGGGSGGSLSGGRRHDVSGLLGSGEVLGASVGPEGEGLMCEPYLKEYIKLGANNDKEEVKKLQIFLNQFFEVQNPVTGVYGPITYEMVKKFQTHQEVAVLTPWTIAGLPTDGPTGYVYKTTKRWINILKCPEMIAITPIPSLP